MRIVVGDDSWSNPSRRMDGHTRIVPGIVLQLPEILIVLVLAWP